MFKKLIETIHEDNIASSDNLLRVYGVQRKLLYNNQWTCNHEAKRRITLEISRRGLSVAKKIPQGYNY